MTPGAAKGTVAVSGVRKKIRIGLRYPTVFMHPTADIRLHQLDSGPGRFQGQQPAEAPAETVVISIGRQPGRPFTASREGGAVQQGQLYRPLPGQHVGDG